jgi:glucose/arabinose dehydrogenase
VIRYLAALAVCLVMAACKPSPNTPSSGVEQINGSERIGWAQRAATYAELATFRYNIYVDGTAAEMQGVSCGNTPGDAGFACSGRLPQMSLGQHQLALTAFIDSGPRLESERSASMTVNVIRATTALIGNTFASITSITTFDGIRLTASEVAPGLDDPTDLAIAPDGRIFIAERTGRIRVIREGRLQEAPAAILSDVVTADRRGLLAIAIDPDYSKTRHVFAIYTAVDGWRIARFRAVGDTLGERAILVDAIDAPRARPAAALRFGPDRKLYAAIDDAGDPVRPGDAGSFNGKILRLNADGTTPADQGWRTPVYALNVNSPRGIDWDALGATLWIVEDAASSGDRLQGVVSENPTARRGTTIVRYNLPPGTGPSGAAVYASRAIPQFAGDLLVAADEGESILRVRFDPADPKTIVSSERLLNHVFGRIRAIAVGPDGAIYFCTPDALVRLFLAPAL